jgi:hypothetical protein
MCEKKKRFHFSLTAVQWTYFLLLIQKFWASTRWLTFGKPIEVTNCTSTTDPYTIFILYIYIQQDLWHIKASCMIELTLTMKITAGTVRQNKVNFKLCFFTYKQLLKLYYYRLLKMIHNKYKIFQVSSSKICFPKWSISREMCLKVLVQLCTQVDMLLYSCSKKSYCDYHSE